MINFLRYKPKRYMNNNEIKGKEANNGRYHEVCHHEVCHPRYVL